MSSTSRASLCTVGGVLLLPYLGQQDLYDQFHLEEPWNSENNQQVSKVPLELFQCPGQPDTKLATTNYMMVVGEHTISNGRQARKITEITDGLTDTILLVEVADSLVYWAQPEDLRFDKLTFTINGGKRQQISSYHRLGANVVLLRRLRAVAEKVYQSATGQSHVDHRRGRARCRPRIEEGKLPPSLVACFAHSAKLRTLLPPRSSAAIVITDTIFEGLSSVSTPRRHYDSRLRGGFRCGWHRFHDCSSAWRFSAKRQRPLRPRRPNRSSLNSLTSPFPSASIRPTIRRGNRWKSSSTFR